VSGIVVPPERPAKNGDSSFDRYYVMDVQNITITGQYSENGSHRDIRSRFQEKLCGCRSDIE
jgi:hypothetical protein